jgi:hypothetical protein
LKITRKLENGFVSLICGTIDNTLNITFSHSLPYKDSDSIICVDAKLTNRTKQVGPLTVEDEGVRHRVTALCVAAHMMDVNFPGYSPDKEFLDAMVDSVETSIRQYKKRINSFFMRR